MVLLSGGIDSAVALWWAKRTFGEVYTITFLYGQRHGREIDSAVKLSKIAGVKEHIIIELRFLKAISTSSLTDTDREVPRGPYPERGIISTYVPMRNSMFGVVACAVMENKNIPNLIFGVHSSDVPNYPDTRPEWASSLEALLNAGSSFSFEKSIRVRVLTPLISLKKHQIIKLGASMDVPFEHTWSCYSPKGNLPCGECPACVQRLEAFKLAGIDDPLKYEKKEV